MKSDSKLRRVQEGTGGYRRLQEATGGYGRVQKGAEMMSSEGRTLGFTRLPASFCSLQFCVSSSIDQVMIHVLTQHYQHRSTMSPFD